MAKSCILQYRCNMQKDTVGNKSKIVRQILQEIGAVSENPPKDWKDTMIQRLKDLNIDIKKVNIYAIRSKEIGKLNQEENNSIDLQNYGSILIELRSFAQKVGGIDKLLEFINLLKELKN